MNSNREMYLQLRDSLQNGDVVDTDALDRRVALLLLREFEMSGVDLPDNEVCVRSRAAMVFCG